MTKPAIIPPEVAPGAKSHYDDFVAVHIQQTLTIHVTANFLSWHRYYIHEYEKALRNDCGYNGALPVRYLCRGSAASLPFLRVFGAES